MKRFVLSFVLCLCFTFAYAQPPQGINYQGVALNSTLTAPLASGVSIGVRITIWDNVVGSGSPLFTQTQTTTTSGGGVFNITIGGSLFPSFADIDWAAGVPKFIQIEIDPAGGTNYTQSGSTQLLSVPYAFHAKYSDGLTSYWIKENLAALKASPGNTAGDIAFMMGYNVAGDGGGGYFVWKTDNVFKTSASGYYSTANDGTIVQANGGNDNGRWVRMYDGFVNVKFFGAMGTWGNYTLQIKRALEFAELVAVGSPDYVAHFQSSTVFVPNGNYIIDTIELKDGVSFIGENMEKTNFYPTNAPGSYVVTMEKGRVRTNVSDMSFIGSYSGSEGQSYPFTGNNPKGLMYLESQVKTIAEGGFNDGGLWASSFKNILITNFKKNGIFLKGSTTNYQHHNNSTVFENIRVYKGDQEADVNALRIEGANSTFTFINCQFDGTRYSGYSKGKNVYLKGYYPGNNSPVLPANISFVNCTFNNADYGIYIDYAENITVDNSLFRLLGYGVVVDGTTRNCKGISVLNNRFYSASGYGNFNPGAGYIKAGGRCIRVTNSYVNIKGNYAFSEDICSSCGFADFSAGNIGVNLEGNTFSIPKVGRTDNIMQQLTQSGTTLVCGQNKILSVNNTGTINTLDSTLNTGETITIKASAALVFSKSGGNIAFPGSLTTLSLNAGEIVKFIKTDSGFQSVSVIRNNP
ncbi:hypothetical protein FLLO111716_09000 [Flavobacterium longum]|uniref:hypothetical protein n=1 Tax=Flavobacterium longum TaxID=1299340 RepID=UPI0039EA9CE8